MESRGTILTIVVLAIGLSVPLGCYATDPAQGILSKHFELRIRPILATKCIKCHGEQKQEGGLRLDSRESLIAGGSSGSALVPGMPDTSLLIAALKYESLEMPPTGQLSQVEIQAFVDWVAAGANWPENIDRLREASALITDEDRHWWAFQSLVKPEIPRQPSTDWCRTPIDHFVLRRLRQKTIEPAPQADKRTLVRRLYYDLIGLPPSPEEVNAYLSDEADDAWEHLIDRLLADPRYGEQWARFWLDLVRYAESDGWNKDSYRPHLWRYRDYVVDSFNQDRPYPEFVRQQLAGDEIPDDDPVNRIATGYLRLGIYEYNQRDARSHWNDIVNEITDVTGDVFLGIGMACARCHDHKFDPLPQVDYYKLRAFFEPIAWRDDMTAATNEQQSTYAKQVALWREQAKPLLTKIDALIKPYHDRKWASTVGKFPLEIQDCFYKPASRRDSWEHQMAYLVTRQFFEEGVEPLEEMNKADKRAYDALRAELATLDPIKPQPLPEVMAATDFFGSIAPTIIPGDPHRQTIEPGFLSVLSQLGEPPHRNKLTPRHRSSGRRTSLAEWIGRADNPLTMRVITNRIWQQHFGRGIVASPNDFGRLGQAPSHPELLDWLTQTFVESGWSMKYLHKLILTSAVWQQSAYHPEASKNRKKDVSETLYWRASVRRLEAEQLRDAMLFASGELEPKIGGPSVSSESSRRALYVKRFRNSANPFLHAFDTADGLKSVAARNVTTTPSQSLLMINGPYALQRAERFAQRLLAIEFVSAASLLDYACQLTWGRAATEEEMDTSLHFIEAAASDSPADVDKEKIIDFCHVLFNSNEFIYRD